MSSSLFNFSFVFNSKISNWNHFYSYGSFDIRDKQFVENFFFFVANKKIFMYVNFNWLDNYDRRKKNLKAI